MPKVKIAFNAALKGVDKPKPFKPGDTVEGEAAKIGAKLGCLENPPKVKATKKPSLDSK